MCAWGGGGPLCRVCGFSGHFAVYLKMVEKGTECKLWLKKILITRKKRKKGGGNNVGNM